MRSARLFLVQIALFIVQRLVVVGADGRLGIREDYYRRVFVVTIAFRRRRVDRRLGVHSGRQLRLHESWRIAENSWIFENGEIVAQRLRWRSRDCWLRFVQRRLYRVEEQRRWLRRKSIFWRRFWRCKLDKMQRRSENIQCAPSRRRTDSMKHIVASSSSAFGKQICCMIFGLKKNFKSWQKIGFYIFLPEFVT